MLIVLSGPASSGKTTLASKLAKLIPGAMVIRHDEPPVSWGFGHMIMDGESLHLDAWKKLFQPEDILVINLAPAKES